MFPVAQLGPEETNPQRSFLEVGAGLHAGLGSSALGSRCCSSGYPLGWGSGGCSPCVAVRAVSLLCGMDTSKCPRNDHKLRSSLFFLVIIYF